MNRDNPKWLALYRDREDILRRAMEDLETYGKPVPPPDESSGSLTALGLLFLILAALLVLAVLCVEK